jgi:hypothetical protein
VASPTDWERTARLSFRSVLVLFSAAGVLLAAFLPYHAWDGLAYGEWSRLIAETGGSHFPTVTAQAYHRPLFYVVQGWIWRLVGHHEAYGRGLGLTFTAFLFLAVWRLSKTICPDPSGLAPYIGALVLIAIPAVAAGICDGMTDVPVACMVACTGVVLWTMPDGGADGKRSALVIAPLGALLSCLAVLAKPSALAGLMGLALAQLLGARAGLRQRITGGCAPIAVGVALALVYDTAEAHRLHESLSSFLMTGTTGPYEQMSTGARLGVARDLGWLGPGLRFPLVLSLLYAALRIGGISNRKALGVAAGLGIALASMGFYDAVASARAVANRILLGIFLVSSVALAVCSFFVARDEGCASRLNLARLVAWMTPGLLIWLWYAAVDERLMSIVWAPLAVLVGCAITPVVVEGLQRRRWTGIVSAAVVLLLAASDFVRVDGLGRGWTAVVRTAASGQLRGQDFRRAVAPELADVVDILGKTLSPHDVLISPEGRLRFFFPGRVAQTYPHGCGDLGGYEYFVLAHGGSMQAIFERVAGVPGTVAYWSACRSPSLSLVSETSAYAIFRIEKRAL